MGCTEGVYMKMQCSSKLGLTARHGHYSCEALGRTFPLPYTLEAFCQRDG